MKYGERRGFRLMVKEVGIVFWGGIWGFIDSKKVVMVLI